MIETIVDPFGPVAFPTVVKCDVCGERLYDGKCDLDGHHWCYDHAPDGARHEFRTCDYCGQPMSEGYTVDGGCWYCCDECFEPMMKRDYKLGYRPNEHDDDGGWCGGYWDYKSEDGEWYDTGIYYTDWYYC